MRIIVIILIFLAITSCTPWIRMPEPNEIGVSVKVKCNGEVARYNLHGGGHWMYGREWFGTFDLKKVDKFIEEKCGGTK